MRPTIKLVPDFIVPHLEKRTFGRNLEWEERERGSFRISRVHQSSEHWSEDCFEVYKAWSLIKRLWKREDPKRITKAKHRLVTALRRNLDIEMLQKESPYYRFRIINQNVLSPKKSSAKSPPKKEDDSTSNYGCDQSTLTAKITEKYLAASDGGCPCLRDDNGTFYRTFRGTSKASDHYFVCEASSEACPVSDENERRFNSTCCCDILLDGFLPNDMCIWHGVAAQ